MLKKPSKGFTLIEIIIVIVILSIIAAISINFLVSSLRVYTMTVQQKTLLDEGKLALERMCRDIRDAKSISSPAAGSSGNLITFTRTNATAQDTANESITFRLKPTDTTILEKVKSSPSATSAMASNVSTTPTAGFTVTRGASGNNEITLVLTLSLTSGENVTLQTKVYPKNLMAIEVDAVSTGTGTGSSITVSHTTSGTNRLMLVGISATSVNDGGSTARVVSSVTYGGVALTLVGSQANTYGEKMWMYKLLAPVSGTANVVVTFAETSTGGAVVGVITFTGVDQTTPLGTFVSAKGDTPISPATVNVTSASGELVFDTVMFWQNAITVGAGQTQRWNIATGINTNGGGSTEPGAASVTMSWTATPETWAIGAVPIKPAATSTATSTTYKNFKNYWEEEEST